MKTHISITTMAALAYSSVEAFVVQPSAPTHSNTRLEYAAALPELSSQHKTQVNRRVRKLSETKTTKPRTKISSKHGAQEAIEVLTMKDFQKEVLDEQDKLVVVRFFAPWCRACKAIGPHYSKFAKDTTKEHARGVKFVDCPLTAVTGEVHKTLGVNTIPFAHVYHPEAGLVEERRLARKHFMGFERTAKTYLDGVCELKGDDARVDPNPNAHRLAMEAALA